VEWGKGVVDERRKQVTNFRENVTS
jgi:hypothetical protein